MSKKSIRGYFDETIMNLVYCVWLYLIEKNVGNETIMSDMNL